MAAHSTTNSTQVWRKLIGALNFYRTHLLFFDNPSLSLLLRSSSLVTPVVAAAIFVASNGRFHIGYTDALFCCISAMTGTGLATIDLSSTTAWQQTILVILELIGSPVAISWFVVYVRRRYFIRELEWIVRAELERSKPGIRRPTLSWTRSRDGTSHPRILTSTMTRGLGAQQLQGEKQDVDEGQPVSEKLDLRGRRLRADMVRRIDASPRPIGSMDIGRTLGLSGSPTRMQQQQPEKDIASGSNVKQGLSEQHDADHPSANISTSPARQQVGLNIPRTYSLHRTVARQGPERHRSDDFGGFDNPLTVLGNFLRRAFPETHQRLHRTFTMPTSATLVSTHTPPSTQPQGARRVPYLSFLIKVGRNSHFRDIKEENYEELGGVEFRALNALMWIVPLYYAATLAVAFIIIAPYMSLPRWRSNFLPPMQHRVINPVWYSWFIVVGAWANTGMSLVDQNLVPFQNAYPMLIFLIWVVLAGNTGFPIFLRFMIWAIRTVSPRDSQLRETLHFLLDHPRRCFIYLFPSRQTWFLFTVLVLMNITDWIFFLILDIGTPVVEVIPVGSRVLLGLVQAVSVRFAGFQSVPISQLAPAVKVLYCVMMYVSAYPVAMSVRSTNVYEDKSLGIFDEENEDIDDDADYPATESRVAIWGMYLRRHIRRQLSFDMWWLAFALFLVCIIERSSLNDDANATWFNIFSIIFEIVSGYATVGLSLGIPTENFSFSGAFHTLSKLIICAVMIRGRHRGLPVALDRAIKFPDEFKLKRNEQTGDIIRNEVNGHEWIDGDGLRRRTTQTDE